MKLVLDNIIFSLQKVGGISVYWFEIIDRLLKTRSHLIFFQRDCDNLLFEKLPKDIFVEKYNNTPLIFDRFFNVNTYLVKSKFIFHSSYYRITKNPNAISVITIHDFIHEKFYTGIRKYLHIYQKKRALKNAKAIIVISENTKRDLFNYYPNLCRDKIIKVIHNGVSSDFKPISCINTFKNSFLFVGSRESYKNFIFSVISISKLQVFTLTIVGKNLNNNEINFLNKYLKNRWTLFNNIDNDKLNFLYNESFALLYPSSYEGFGIPLLESMKAGCPFIAFNRSSIPEVAGNAGYLMNNIIFDDFYNGVLHILGNREELIKLGYKQSDEFNWDKCFKQTFDFYEEIYI
jgi:mannosyltransferase